MNCPILPTTANNREVNNRVQQKQPEEYVEPYEKWHTTPFTILRCDIKARQYNDYNRCAASEYTSLQGYHLSPYTVILLPSLLLLPRKNDLIAQ